MGRGSTDQKSCEGFYIYLVLHFLSDNNPEKKKENQISEEMFVKINAVSSTVLIVLMLLSFGKET